MTVLHEGPTTAFTRGGGHGHGSGGASLLFGSSRSGGYRRRAAYIVIILGMFAVLTGVGSCGSLLQPLTVPTATPVATPTAVPTARLVPTPLPIVTAPTATPTATPISQTEAQSVVAAWFDAVLAQDYQTASNLTAGVASDRTQQLSEGFSRATGGNQVRLAKQRLDLSPGLSQPDGGQAVVAAFDVLVNAQMGPVTFTVQHLTGNATFVVQRVDDRTRITDIQDVTGLPVLQ